MANKDMLRFVYNSYKVDNPIIKAEIEAALDIEIEFDFDDYDMTEWHPQYKFIKGVIDEKGIYLIKPIYEKYSITKEMKEALEKVGDTPMKEPKLYEAVESNDEEIIASAIKDITGIDKETETLMAYSLFVTKLMSKVFSLEDEKGVLKTTEDTIKVGFIGSDDAKKVSNLMKKASDDEKIFEVIYEAIRKKYKLDKDAIEWRKKLVGEYVYRQIIGVSKTGIMGL